MYKSISAIPSLDISEGMLFRVLNSTKENVVLQPILEEGAISIDRKDFEKHFELHSFD